MYSDELSGRRKSAARAALILIILVGVVSLISSTLSVPESLGEPLLALDYLGHPSAPIVFMLLFFLGVVLVIYLSDRFSLLFLLPLLLVAVPPLLEKQIDYVTSGAVMAFNLEECPRELGWEPFDPARNRVIVGVGPARKDELGNSLSERVLGGRGGAERRLITRKELPAHNHTRGDYNRLVLANRQNTAKPKHLDSDDPDVANEVNLRKSNTIKPWGSKNPRPLEHMPPFVALSYCIKR